MRKDHHREPPFTRLVVVLSKDPEMAAYAQFTIGQNVSITAEPVEGHYLPLLIKDDDASRVRRWLDELPGVSKVDEVVRSSNPSED